MSEKVRSSPVAPSDVTATRIKLKTAISRLLTWLAFIGVPFTVVIVSGGWKTVAFWLTALVWVPTSFLGAFPFGLLLLVVVAPVLWVLHRYAPGRAELIIEGATILFWGGIWVAGYVLGADLDGSLAGLPDRWTNIAALTVLVVATAISYGLVTMRDRLNGKTRRPAPLPPSLLIPEPGDEFWSAEGVVAWRAWTWTGSALHGVFARWDREELEAVCDACDAAPSWYHVCGIYGVKEPDEIDRFVANANVVGRVEMWGAVIEHEHGYRSSHARITELWVTDYDLAAEIAACYPGVPVRVGRPASRREVPWPT